MCVVCEFLLYGVVAHQQWCCPPGLSEHFLTAHPSLLVLAHTIERIPWSPIIHLHITSVHRSKAQSFKCQHFYNYVTCIFPYCLKYGLCFVNPTACLFLYCCYYISNQQNLKMYTEMYQIFSINKLLMNLLVTNLLYLCVVRTHWPTAPVRVREILPLLIPGLEQSSDGLVPVGQTSVSKCY